MENRPFFDPYIFGPYISHNLPPNVSPAPSGVGTFITPELSPKEFYENQYFYYRYLNEMLDYKIKSREYEKISGTHSSQPQQNKIT